MQHRSSFLTGFLTGQRLKRWQTGFASGDVPGGGTNFYDWAGQSGAPPELTDPDAYAQYAASINPSLRLNSDNTLTWQPTVDDITAGSSVIFRNGSGTSYTTTSRAHGFAVNAAGGWSGQSGAVFVTLNPDRRSWLVVERRGVNTGYPVGLDYYSLTAVIDGTHNPSGSPAVVGYGNRADGTSVNLSKNYGNAPVVMYAGRSYGRGFSSALTDAEYTNYYDSYTTVSRASASFDNYLPTFNVIPHSTNGLILGPRPGRLTGSPLNEQAKTFTHPLTGEIISFDSFTYDYQTRTYTLTLPGGNKMDVSFGDDTIKITEGLGGGEINVEGETEKTVEAMYPDNAGLPIVSPDGAFQKEAFLSGLAAGMASQGY